MALAGSRLMPRASDASDFPFNPALRITSSVNPSRGTTRASMPAAVPTNVTVASGTRAMQLACDGDARIQVPARSASRDQDR